MTNWRGFKLVSDLKLCAKSDDNVHGERVQKRYEFKQKMSIHARKMRFW